jgi:hypothetical protein
MEQINKLETIFSEGSLTDRLNALETSLLRGGASILDHTCDVGWHCEAGTETWCSSGISCDIGKIM